MTTANIGTHLHGDLHVITDPNDPCRDLFQSLVVRLDAHPLIRANRAKKRPTCAVCHRPSCDAPVR